MVRTVDKGYGSGHQKARAEYQARLDAGATYQCSCVRPDCPHHTPGTRCPTLITKGTDWDLDHTDDRTQYNGPACVPCNRSHGYRKARATTPSVEPMTIRTWCEPLEPRHDPATNS